MSNIIKLQYSLNAHDLDVIFTEYQQAKRVYYKYLSMGFYGALLITFVAYFVFNQPQSPQLIYQLVAGLIIYTVIFTFAYYRMIAKIIESSINRKSVALEHNLTVDPKKFELKTKYITYTLQVEHFKTIYVTDNYLHLEWSAKKASNLREIGTICIPRKSFLNRALENEFLEYFTRQNVKSI